MIGGFFIATVPVMTAQGGAGLRMLIILLLLLTAKIAAIFLIVMPVITAIPGIFLRLICFAFTTVFVLVEAFTCTASGL